MTHMSIKFKELVLVATRQILCHRCQARSKRTHLHCGAPAERSSQVCRFHGSRSTGPKTSDGKARAMRTTHGNSTRADRRQLSKELVQIQRLPVLAWLTGMVPTIRPSGRPPGSRSENE